MDARVGAGARVEGDLAYIMLCSVTVQHHIFSLISLGCISSTTIAAASLNLVGSDSWRDLISGETVDLFSEAPTIELAPYQAVWLTNTIT